MVQKCTKTAKLLLATIVVAAYLTLGLLSIQRPTKPDLPATPRTLVGYSWEYKLQEDLKQDLNCKTIIPDTPSEKISKWQYDEVVDFHFLSAFYDLRLHPYRYVRIVGLAPKNSSFYCQIWFSKNGSLHSVTRKAHISLIWSENWGKVRESRDHCNDRYPSLVSCSLPLDFEPDVTPSKVSFVDRSCSGKRVFADIQRSESVRERLNFVVCVKPLHFSDYNSASLSEWIRFNKIFGADRIYFYGTNRSNTFRRFAGTVRHVTFETPLDCSGEFGETLWWKRKLEIITYNDCFYRNVHTTKFVIPLDVDEVLVPKTADDWFGTFRQIFNESEIEEYSSFSVRNVYFFRKYPIRALKKLQKFPNSTPNPNSSIFERTVRSFRFSPGSDSSKSFVNVGKTLTVFNHYSFHVLGQPYRRFVFPEQVIQLSHYRSICDPTLIDGCHNFLNDLTYDDSLDKFRNKIESNGYRSN